MAMIAKHEPISLEIKTKSIEKTLIPLVTQVGRIKIFKVYFSNSLCSCYFEELSYVLANL